MQRYLYYANSSRSFPSSILHFCCRASFSCCNQFDLYFTAPIWSRQHFSHRRVNLTPQILKIPHKILLNRIFVGATDEENVIKSGDEAWVGADEQSTISISR